MVNKIERSALVWHSAERMFGLVNDVVAYPQFLPWCASAEVHHTNEQEITASLEVAKGGVRQRFTTRNQLVAPSEIQMVLVDGPFTRLKGCWRFHSLDERACKVQLTLEFEFTGTLARMAFGTVFNQAANTLVDAFCKRANDVYGASLL